MRWASFWRELRERKLVQWGIGYVAAALVVLQLTDLLSGTFGWPAPVLRVLTVLLAFTFLAVLVLAWYHGERGHQRMHTPELLLLALIAIVAGLVSWRLARPPAETANPTASSGASGAVPVMLERLDDDRPSIAVRPFTNIGGDPANEYFSDGITEDIIARLSQIGGLRVISRTSVMQYKTTDKTIRQIGQELGVEYVLEGSVQRSDEDVRIIAQLIDASTDVHVWSQIFDQRINDILAVQSEVAERIAAELKAQLTPTVLADLRDNRSVDPAAYTLVLKGREAARGGDAEGRARAIILFDSAIAKDSSYVGAYSALAEAMVPATIGTDEGPPAPEYPRVTEAIDRAMSRHGRAEFHLLELDRAARSWDFARAEAQATRAIHANPNYSRAYHHRGMILARTGRYAEALEQLTRAQKLDPRSAVVNADLGELLYAMGRFDDAIAQLRHTLELDSRSPLARMNLGLAYQAKGMHDEAVRELRRARALAQNGPFAPMVEGALGFALATGGRVDEARRMLKEMSDKPRPPSGAIVQVLVGLGETGPAIAWFEKAVAEHSRTLLRPHVNRALERLREDPRFAEIMKTAGWPDSIPSGGRPPPGPRGSSRTRR